MLRVILFPKRGHSDPRVRSCPRRLVVLLLLLPVVAGATAEGPAVPLTDVPADVAHVHDPGVCPVLCPALPSAFGAVPSHLAALGDRLFFAAGDRARGGEPWVSDGTMVGTVPLADLCPGGCSSAPVPIGVLEREGEEGSPRLLFWATTPATGREPWVTDGTVAGTMLLADLCPGACDSGVDPEVWWREPASPFSSILGAAFGDEVFFGVWESGSVALYASDGSPGGTRRVTGLCGDGVCLDPPFGFTVSEPGDRLYFLVREDGVFRPWVSDGSVEGTARLDLGCSDGEVAAASHLVSAVGGVALSGGCVDATHEGPRDVYVHRAGEEPVALGIGEPVDLVALEPWVVTIRGNPDGPQAQELWISSGTPDSTFKSLDLDRTYVRVEAAAPHVYLYTPPEDPDRPASQLFATEGFSPPWQVNVEPVPTTTPFREVAGRALWWESPRDADAVYEYRLVSYGLRIPHRVEQGFVAPTTVPGSDERQADVPPRLAPVGDRLFLGANGGEGNQLWRLDVEDLEPGCFERSDVQCLRGGRFQVAVRFRNQHDGGIEGTATPEEVSRTRADDTGFFWFFRPDNLELAVKVLDGRPVNGHWWVFSGGITDLEYELEVTDLVTGETRIWLHLPGDLCSVVDTLAFHEPPSGSSGAPSTLAGSGPAPPAGPRFVQGAITPPPPPECDYFSGQRACVGPDARFSMQVSYVNQHAGGEEGIGDPFPETRDTATVRFFPRGGVEALVKILDGREANGHWWVFWGGLTDLGYTVDVLDRETGEMRTFTNPVGSTCGGADVTAFAEAP